MPSERTFAIEVAFDRTEYSCDDCIACFVIEVRPPSVVGAGAPRLPADLVLVLDVSGSMNREGRYPLMKAALERMVGVIGDDDRLAVILFSSSSDTVLPLDATSAEVRGVVAAVESSHVKFGESTRLASALVRALEEFDSTKSDVNRVRRLYCLTDGEIHDLDQCAAMLWKARDVDFSFHIYGFGHQFNVDQLNQLIAPFPHAVVKAMVDTQDVEWTFQHLAASAKKIVARDVLLDVAIDSPVICGDYYLYRPTERYLGVARPGGTRIRLGPVESGRSYSQLFQTRLPEASPGTTTRVGRWVLSYDFGDGTGWHQTPMSDFSIRRSAAGGAETRIALSRDLLAGIRDDSTAAQIARCLAQIELYRAESRDPELIRALERRLARLRNPENTPVDVDLRDRDALYIRSTPKTQPPPDRNR